MCAGFLSGKMRVILLGWFFRIQVFTAVFAGAVLHHKHKTRDVLCATKHFEQKLDHFSFSTNKTFNQRYILCREHWKHGGPILFYTGNEGDIMMFVNNTGFMFELAPQLDAMVIFAEHRYYGTSKPDDGVLNGTTMGYLSSLQALADFNDLIYYLKKVVPGAQKSPVVAFGGSYGGMLAAWMRMKYPATVIGAISSSAPILQFGDQVPCDSFSRIVTKDYELAAQDCPKAIQRSWSVIEEFWRTQSGRDWLKDTFHLCGPLDNKTVKVDDFRNWLITGWSYMAMTDYPYTTNFLKPMPGWPVKAACRYLSAVHRSKSDKTLLRGIFKAVSVYYNYTGLEKSCFNLTDNSSGTALGDTQWDYQACSEMVLPDCSNGKTDMFPQRPWNLTEYTQSCMKSFGVRPDTQMAVREYGGEDLEFYSNIVFSNGNLDPWSGGGVLTSTNPSIVVILIQDAAHHLDLRAANKGDPPSVVEAREQEIKIIRQWIAQHRRKLKSGSD